MTNRLAVILTGAVILAGCAHTPRVHISELSQAYESRPAPANGDLMRIYDALVASLRGKQYGDLVFQENSAAYLITPRLELLNLEIGAAEAGIRGEEIQARSNRIRTLHQHFLIFSLDLRLPFYAGWSQSELLDFLKTNLVITLENGSGQTLLPQRRIFNISERFHEQYEQPRFRPDSELEVRIPVRVYFSRDESRTPLLAQAPSHLELKLRLLESPPYIIGFWDDKFFQGFRWKIVKGEQAVTQTTVK